MSTSDSDLERALSVATTLAACSLIFAAAVIKKKTKRGGSRPEKRPNRNLHRGGGAIQLDTDYFCREKEESPLFSEEEFERRFGVTCQIYETVREAVLACDDYFQQTSDATGLLGASTDQKLAAAFRQMSMGITADACVDYLRTGESLNLKSLKGLTRAIVACFKSTWLRYPNENEIIDIETTYSKLGFPGCIGGVDCPSWEWDKCPVALQGQYKEMNKMPNCRMEVVCDDKLRIWHIMFGAPGAKNDKSILNQSSLFNAIRSGQWPPVRPRVCIAGYSLAWFYYLADGIYPDFCIFAKPHPNPRTARELIYGAYQSSARKGVERVFAVLFSQFEILARPSRLHHLEDMEYVVSACCILHNMIAAERGYAGTAKFRLEEDVDLQNLPISLQQIQRPSSTYEQAQLWRDYLDPLENREEYMRFRGALEAHIWNTAGEVEKNLIFY